ncbi:MAG: carboxypeptidase M32 [Candidatus Kapabacteria bacterium]|nr:carboxypeptidase M32 [Candidatus Kapabacteria bacterium]
MSDNKNYFNEILEFMGKIKDLRSALALLMWDQETYIPKGAHTSRANQITTLESLIHSQLISKEAKNLFDVVEKCKLNCSISEQQHLKLFSEELERAFKIPSKFIKELSIVKSEALDKWKQARSESNYSIFKNIFAKLIEMKIQEAEFIGFKENPYDAFLNLYEPGSSVRMIDPLFNELKIETIQLLKSVKNQHENITYNFLYKYYSADGQSKMSRFIAESIGFNYINGRFDFSVHPITLALDPKDVRLTTKINVKDLRLCLFSTIHETGHGIYEQGIDSSLYRTFAAEAASIGIHESQSLIWENMICKTLEFSEWVLPHLKRFFPDNLKHVSHFDFYKAINKIQPSLIRSQSDELTYNLHIILRYELENALLNNKLSVSDLQEAWNEKMRDYLGLIPESPLYGCLQDIHWAFGDVGYFPSYTLGKLYAATMWKYLRKDLKNIFKDISDGNFISIKEWLADKVHRHGKMLTADDIIRRISGEPLSASDFIDYITKKCDRIIEN